MDLSLVERYNRLARPAAAAGGGDKVCASARARALCVHRPPQK